ncbi:hypothetical protein C9374_001853 [Naegleria lovaniensis]|uniref:t-SNARE coiled-coil homology domain-containing protein n=1 Tax=Naegleria lovaniensis TaxID=51637 RepID=A0AA88GVT8_NAELO|nr:uncharacterized protein C9374_001853 [Naegleria lovaniensis]KAG2386818.1 hypothetical protein C9374_001853 [Naegleria lovaniensis]
MSGKQSRGSSSPQTQPSRKKNNKQKNSMMKSSTTSSSGFDMFKSAVNSSIQFGKESIADLRKSILDTSFNSAAFTDEADSDDELYRSARSVFSSTYSTKGGGKSKVQYESSSESDVSLWEDKEMVQIQSDSLVKRNLTNLYSTLRTKQKERQRLEENENFFFTDDSSLQAESLLQSEHESQRDVELGESQNPEDAEWIQLFETCKEKLASIASGIVDLKKLHQQHVKFTVQKDFASEEEEIKVLTNNLKQSMTYCKKLIDQFDKYELLAKKKKRKQFRLVITNAKKSLFTSLSELSTDLQREQRSFLDKLTQLKSKKKELQKIHTTATVEEFSKEELERIEAIEQRYYEPNVTQEQVEELVRREREIIQRDRELREVLASIVELHELFQQISALIIEQGSLLDRIDHNIEITREHIVEGNENLIAAEKAQKCGCFMYIIIFLSVVVVFLAFLVIIKLSLR